MKKIILSLAFLLTMVMGSYGQVTVGEGTGTSSNVPINAYYGYTYSQSIYLASEINASGSITSIQFYYNGTGAMPNSQGWTVYLGHTAKTSFDTDVDYVPVADLTAVYTGGFVTGSAPGWKTITLTTPFVFDGTSNLIVAVDENLAVYDDPSDVFRVSELGANRAIYAYSDDANINPADPSNDQGEFVSRGRVNAVPNIIFGGITQACVNPSALTATNATTTQATIGWTGAAGQSDYEVYVVEQGSGAPDATTVGTLVTGATSYTQTGLFANTAYSAYVRAKCSETLFSVWSGPRNFRTLCDPFGDFTENFDEATVGTGLVPNCWNKVSVSTSQYANVSVIDYTAASAPNALLLSNSDDANAQLYAVTPSLTAIGANTHRMKFKARGGSAGQILSVGTMSDPTDASTYVELQSFVLTATYADYSVALNTSTTANFLAFKHGLGGTYRSVYLDDMIWEPIPSAPPGCIDNMNAVPNEGCGNFPTVFTWTAVSGADGYTVSIGTSPNGADLVVNNVDINSALTYSFTGNPATTYYYTVRPYNANGPAVNCFEDTFTTYGDGCYCISGGINVDSQGITSVTINGTQFSNSAITSTATPPVPVYTDHTEDGATDVVNGVITDVTVTFSTGTNGGFDYHTIVWIDANDNYIFENTPEERVFVGVSAAVSPTTLNASFLLPLSTPLGEHRMRIVGTDSQQLPSNPCYNGYYGETIDLLINVLPPPACLPPSASSVSNITASSATLNWVSDGTLFNVEYDFAGFTQGGGTVVSGITGNTTTLSNLDPQADYAYYIQTDCGSGSLSPWTGPFAFRTACAAFGDFTEDFTTDVTIPAPECWFTAKTTDNQYAAVSVNSFSDNVQFYNSGDAAAALYLITPALTALPTNTHHVKFKANSTALNATLVVGTMSDPANASTFTAVQTIPLSATSTTFSVAFINPTTDTHVAFRFIGTGTYQYAYLDDFIWEVAPSCPDVNIATFIDSTPYTADISWTPGATETTWEYAYALSTVTEPDGLTTYPVSPNPNTTITGLQPSSTYNVWVRATCGSEFGNWSPAKTFITACVAVTSYPWTEGFEGTSGTGFPPCWSKENGDWSTAVTETYNTPRTGSRYLRDGWGATNEYMWTPGFELTAGVSYDFSFYIQGDGYTSWAVDVFQNTVQNSVGATQVGGTTTPSGTGTYVIQPYALVSNTIVPTTTGTYYFAVRVNEPTSIPWYVAFDDFRMEPTPTCVAPAAPTVTDVTVTTATINWTATTPAPADGYDYFVTTDLATTPNATTVPTATVGAGVTTDNLTNLTSSTVYNCYVRSRCSATEFSSWSDAGLFTTPCAGFDAPFSEDFSTFLPLCWVRAGAGTIATGPTGTDPGIWFADGFLNVGETGAVKVNLYTTNRIGWLITPEMNTTIGNAYALSFNYGVTAWGQTTPLAMGSDDTVKVAMTTDDGLTWTEVHTFNAASNVSNTSQLYTYEFNAPTSQARFALIATDGTVNDSEDYDFFVDNFAMEAVLSTGDFTSNSFTAYPNPVKDVLNVSFMQNISSVSVLNILGQQMLFVNVNANKGQVDMSNMPAGTYLVKVTTDSVVKTIKVIKE